MVDIGQTDPRDVTIARLETELAVALARAADAEDQLQRVHGAVRAFKQKQELANRARDAREARARAVATEQAEQAAAAPQAMTPGTSGLGEGWNDPDPSLDERLDKYLESSFEPDRSRDWMLQD